MAESRARGNLLERKTQEIEQLLQQRIDALATQFRNNTERHARMITNRLEMIADRLDQHAGRIRANEEAICPRVAARLTALERASVKDGWLGSLDGKSWGPRPFDQRANQPGPKMQAPDLRNDESSYHLTHMLALVHKLSRAARHELIVKLTDLNRGA